MIDGAPVNVKDFGAVGDGVTDDTVAIQNAINACANSSITLFIPDGVFMYANVTVPSGKALSIQGLCNKNSILKQISPYSSSTAGITSTGPLQLNNVCIDQNWLSSVQPSISGYDDGADPNTWGGYWVININTTEQVEISNCHFINICRGVVISNSTYVDFFNNYSDSTNSIAQSICATSNCQQVSMNQNTLISKRWTTNQGNGGCGMFNFNATNLELCNNTTVGHQWVGRGSLATFTASISGTTMTVSAVASGKLAVGQTFIGTNVLSDNTIISQISGTPGGAGIYNVAFSNTGASGTFKSYMARLVVANNIIDTPVADTAFYGYKNATISGNVVRMSGDMGITIDGSQYVSIVGNSINGTRVGGINVSNAYSVVISDNNIKDIGQGSQGPYAIIDQYGRYASNGNQWLSAITVNFLVNVPPSKGIVISNNSMWFENTPPISDIYGTVANKVKGIYIESTTNPNGLFGINTCSITGNFVESIYSTVPQFFVYAFDHRFYSASGTGTPIAGELFSDGSGNSFIFHSHPSGFGGLIYLKKMVGTVGNGVTFTGALSGSTIVSTSAGGGAALTYVGISGAGNNDWTTTRENMNLGV